MSLFTKREVIMKIRTGIDIIEIERIKQSIENTENKFCDKIYTKLEIEYCESKKNQKYQHYAARFAAKEAVFKALSQNLNNKYDITWQDIQILNDKNGKPYVQILNKDIKEIGEIEISISHCKQYAVANVIIYND